MNAHTVPCRLSMKAIIEIAAQFFGVSVVDLISPRREAHLVEARSIAMYTIRELLPRSYPEIANAFGGRDHTTAIHACRKVLQEILLDQDKRERVEAFIAICRASAPLSPPDTNPFEAARTIMQRPGLATNVSVETIRNFAAIVSAAIQEASKQDEAVEKLEALTASFKAVEPSLRTFIHMFHSLQSASPRGEDHARRAFDKAAANLVAELQTHFQLKGH